MLQKTTPCVCVDANQDEWSHPKTFLTGLHVFNKFSISIFQWLKSHDGGSRIYKRSSKKGYFCIAFSTSQLANFKLKKKTCKILIFFDGIHGGFWSIDFLSCWKGSKLILPPTYTHTSAPSSGKTSLPAVMMKRNWARARLRQRLIWIVLRKEAKERSRVKAVMDKIKQMMDTTQPVWRKGWYTKSIMR